MQTLRFHTNRIFVLVSIIFFILFLIIAHQKLFKYDDYDDFNVHHNYKGKLDFKDKKLERHFGEQASFPKQGLPHINEIVVDYKSLNVDRNINYNVVSKIKQYMEKVNVENLIQNECPINITLEEHWKMTKHRQVPKGDTWEVFYSKIGSCNLYQEESYMKKLLHELSTLKIKTVHVMEGGTQIKLLLTFINDKQAVFKPMRFGRDYETDENHFYFSDFERHNSEIATFHLDKILGFRRAVPTVGRVVNLTSEILDNSDRNLRRTFFISPANNLCFVGKCDYYCDTTHAICGSPNLKEGSVQVFLPDEDAVPRKHSRSPYRRTYSKKRLLATWQTNMNYCTWNVKSKKKYAHGRRILDMVDTHIMDFLIGNQDRHHFETFNIFENTPPYNIHIDNGRGFGKTNFDDEDILLPLRQCCVIRSSTLVKLMTLYTGEKGLTETLHESMSQDPVQPILAYKHYPAMERRLNYIMNTILECLDKNSDNPANVIMAEYHNDSVARSKNGEMIDDDDLKDS
ncbi:Glycosaminoglycan xylosylkinase [Strongyloides ratti]|uniref:Glycosaminoglycan xylosylkinase n=1 Tax=Strongyloides ratti TaxID=34506 RepID=A0A090LML4_STRRB|nr:Glycosaminoglycan xylosylkinase [Strongyloides ratti]CEF70981.1 Glycosaminoglycan xylosylkinase [Strongyloides ratti]